MTKKWIITGAALLAAGAVICGASFAALGFDWKELNTAEQDTNTYQVSDEFTGISIDTDIDDITFLPSKDGRCSVVCVEEKNRPHSVTVEGGTLRIESSKDRRTFDWHFMTVTQAYTVTVYLPETEYEDLHIISDSGDVQIPKELSFENITAELDTGDISCFASVRESVSLKTDTGDINASDISAESMDLRSDTGDIKLSGIELGGSFYSEEDTGDVKIEGMTCESFTSKGDTGDLDMKGVKVSQKLALDRDTGDITFDGCDAEELLITTDTGDVRGSLLTEKVFITKTDTGDVNVPDTTSGGRCEIITNTGDINIKVQ
ncbi:MAG: DUF4097 family beta strand repeat protein [Ruminococcus sp.]|nr:DUF4097 family beta strand repeat protein [Ruminococcus sp.]